MAEMGAASLTKLDILVAQLESIVVSASLKSPDPLMCFDLLSDLLSSMEDHSKETILACQRKCEDALQNLLLLGVRPPVRRLAAKALVRIIEKGDSISIYSRASSLQGWLSETRKVETSCYIGAANCLGALYRSYGQKITSGLLETSNIVIKLMKSTEICMRQAALQLLQDALEGSGGGGPLSAYSEALRVVLRVGATDRSPTVRAIAANCLRAFALAGGPGLGAGGLENCAAICVKALEDNCQSVRDAYAAALGALLALGLNPDAQIQPRGKIHVTPAKTIEGGLQKYLIGPFMRVTGPLSHNVRVGLTMAWVAFLQGMHLTYGHSDLELQNYALQAMGMLTFNSKSQINAHPQACILYILRVGIVEQMSELAQKEFLTFLTKQLSLPDTSASMLVVILRTISHLLAVLREVPLAAREALENSLVVTLSNATKAVRVETALTIGALAEVDPVCANSLMSFGLTTMRALQEIVAIERGDRLRLELDLLHGQATMLAALLAASSRLPLGVPSRLPAATLEVAKRMVLEDGRNPFSVGAEKEAGWLLIAAVVCSMTKEEMQEQEFDIIALWTVPFGGNSDNRLKKAEENLAAEICGWSAAVEALTAFVTTYVVSNLSSAKEGILLQPVLGYLNGALAYISSPVLQQAPVELKEAVDLFTIRTLAAFHALPDPFLYKSDHKTLLGICANPLRDPSLWGESSSLRQLLDCRDASLGPWIPGRDSFEDELRAFEGGSDGPLPCVWANDIFVFPQPLPVATLLVNQMLLCFGLIFVAQSEVKKQQLLDMIDSSAKTSKKQSWHEANTTNVCVALLATLKTGLGLRAIEYEPEVFRRLQSIFQGFLAEEPSTPAQRRAAAEGLGVLARLGDDVFAARLMRSLLTEAAGTSDVNLKGSIAFALGCIHRSKGGMALSVLVPATVQTLCMMARDPNDALHTWSLHGLWLTTDAAGLSYVRYVQATMSLAMDTLLSEEHAGPELRQSLGRLVNAIIAVIGPELSPKSSFFSRCKSVVSEISSWEEPAALLECVLFTQQLVLFAPQAVSVHTHVQTLRPTLSSRQPSLRQAAVSTLRHLAERDPISMIDERIEENLFAMLDTETDAGIVELVRLTVLCLLEAAGPSCPSRWLHLCRNVVLATSSTIASGGRPVSLERESESTFDAAAGDESFVNDEEGMITRSDNAGQPGMSLSSSSLSEGKLKDGEQLPRYSTRLFAAECLSRLPVAVGEDPRHFNLLLAKSNCTHRNDSKGGRDWLVLQLGQLVALAYQVATGVFEGMRPKGVILLVTILDKFGETDDPDFNEHLLLEQYQAQFVSAVRTALDPSAGPLLLDAGLRLAARIITSGISNGDAGVFRRVIALIARPLNDFEDLLYPSYAEWVGCKVQVTLLSAHAAVKIHACACMRGASDKEKEGIALMTLLADLLDKLGHFWIGLLKDFTILQISTPSHLQLKYAPFLDGLLLPAVASIVQPYLDEVWPVILEAVTVDVAPAASLTIASANSFTESNGIVGDAKKLSQSFSTRISLSAAEFHQIWSLCLSALCRSNKQGPKKLFSAISFRVTSFTATYLDKIPGVSESQVVALKSIQHLCKEGFYNLDMLTCDLCQELFQVLICVSFKTHLSASTLIIPILKQVLQSSPDEFFENEDLVLTATEISMYYAHRALSSAVAERSSSFSVVDKLMSSIFETLEILGQRSSCERQSQLMPILLSMGIKFITVAPMVASALTNAVTFVLKLTVSPGMSAVDQQASMLTSVIQNLAQCSTTYISNSIAEEKIAKDVGESTSKLPTLLGLMIAVAQNFMDRVPESNARSLILEQCIECLHQALTSPLTEIQLAGLQTLRSVAQKSTAEHKNGSSYELALFLMRDLGTDVVNVVYNSIKVSLTATAATSVGESLKLLVLLHSLVEGDEAQLEVLHVLLPVTIAAASVDMKDDLQIAAGLRAVAVKLVIHLASQSDYAAQFRSVLSEMPFDLRQKLQDIIRASVSTQGSNSSTGPTPSFPVTAQKLVVTLIPPGLKPSSEAPPSSSNQDGRSSTLIPVSKGSYEAEDEDDDWDDFQSQAIFPSSETPQAEADSKSHEIEEDDDFDTFQEGKFEDTCQSEAETINSRIPDEHEADESAEACTENDQLNSENVNSIGKAKFDSFQEDTSSEFAQIAEVSSGLTELPIARIDSGILGDNGFRSLLVNANNVEGKEHDDESFNLFHGHSEHIDPH